MKLLKNILDFFLSLKTSLWLLGIILLLLLSGAFIMPGRQEFQDLHSIPLFSWLTKQPLELTWWLWGLIFLLGLLACNTLFCSIESIIKKRKVTSWLLLISPQIIHIGFLFILLAHFLSSMGASQSTVTLMEGFSIPVNEETSLKINNIDIDIDQYGYVTDWKVKISYFINERTLMHDTISPNSPSVQMGFNINVRDISAFPRKTILLQINREPGAVWALTGGILFMAGIVTLIILRVRMER